MRWAVHVASRTGLSRNENKILVGEPESKRRLGRPKVDWRVILKCISRHEGERCALHSSGLVYRPVEGYCEHSKEPSGSVQLTE